MSEHPYTRSGGHSNGPSRGINHAWSDSSWGTPSSVHSKASLGTITTNLSFGSHHTTAPPSNHSWGSSTIAVPSAQGGWVGPMPGTPPYLANSPMSTATTLVNSPMHGHGTIFPHPDYTNSIRISPLLAPGGPSVDLFNSMRANNTYFPSVNFNTSAFLPPLSYATLLFADDQRWSFKLAESHGLTVWEILEQIIQYLQMPDAIQDLQAVRASATPNPQREIRYPNTLPGAKRIDMLRGRRMFKGLTPAAHGDNCWFVNIA